MYKVRFINFDHDASREAYSLEEAKDIARRAGFQSVIYSPKNQPVATYCPMAGFRGLFSGWPNAIMA